MSSHFSSLTLCSILYYSYYPPPPYLQPLAYLLWAQIKDYLLDSKEHPAQALLHVLAKARVGCFARDRPSFAPDLPLRCALLLGAQECESAAKVGREDSDRGAEG